MTHTFATLQVSAEAYDEIADKLKDAKYDHAFVDDAIDMHGIGLVRGQPLHEREPKECIDDLTRRLEVAQHALERVRDYASNFPNLDACTAIIETVDDALAERTQAAPDKIADLVSRFSTALLQKLREAEQKYGFGDDWLEDDWRDELVLSLAEHVAKGDPRDVAAYAAFAWHHGWSVALPDPQEQVEEFVSSRFGDDVLADLGERVDRVFEEAAELAQSEGRTADHMARILAYVYSRDVGAPPQEAAGVAVTLLAYGAAKGLRIRDVEAREIARIMAKPPQHFRMRQAAKAALGVALPPTVEA